MAAVQSTYVLDKVTSRTYDWGMENNTYSLPYSTFPQVSLNEIRTMLADNKTLDDVQAVSDERAAKAQAVPVGQCRACGGDIARGGDYEIRHGAYWHSTCLPDRVESPPTEADRHGPGCAWFDGIVCDCRG